MEYRLQKYLAYCGIGSRRSCEKLIEEGKVTVNGIIAKLGDKVDSDNDVVKVSGKDVKITSKKLYIMLHKPIGYISSVKDEKERRTVVDLVQKDISERIYPVGRLDYNTEGLLLLTNDGEFMNKITSPKNSIKKTYLAQVKGGLIKKEELAALRRGVVIDGYKTKPAQVTITNILNDNTSIVEITITEGKNRQVRKMFESVGHEVINLKRTEIHGVKLGNLPYGKWRYLNPEEVKLLMK